MNEKLASYEFESKIDIKVCQEEDLAKLNEAIPGPGFHEARFHEQESGKSTYLVAWEGDTPVGHLDIKWQGFKQPVVREFLMDTPELSAIAVYPPEKRSNGIGSTLISKAEELVKGRGFKQAGLAVKVNNTRARELYEKLGYHDWGHGTYTDMSSVPDNEGQASEYSDTCYYMIKDL